MLGYEHTTSDIMTDKEREALNLFIESVIKPDHLLRNDAKERGCYDELLQWRERVLTTLRMYEQGHPLPHDTLV